MWARLTHGATLAAGLLACACVRDAATKTPDPEDPPVARAASPPVRDLAAFVSAVDALAQDAIEQGPVAGLSIAVYERGTPLLASGYGLADLEAHVPATADTSYPIASVSKNFTAALILRLADQGRLGLDDPLSRFFPGARPRIGMLTLRHLLDHTSGLTRGGPAPRAAARNVIRRGGTARPQGEAWDYSNYNYSLLGLVIEAVTGRDYASHVHEEIAAPLGLTGTGYCEDGTAVPGRARDYLSGKKRVSRTAYWTQAHFFAAGGLCSTVVDLVRWEQALESGRVVSPAMLTAMRTATPLPEGIAADYGLGTRMGSTDGHRKVGHTGGGQGNKAVLARYPDDDVTVAVLLNTERDNASVTANDLEERIARLLFASTATPVREIAALPAPTCEGAYLEGARPVQITTEEGMLTRRPGYRHQAASRLVPDGQGWFVVEDDASIALRFQVRDGLALGYARYRNGWFSGVAVRTDEAFRRVPDEGRRLTVGQGTAATAPP